MSYKLTFERKEKGRAYFKDANNKTIILPEDYASKELKEGDFIYLAISKEDNVAKDILNELLDTDK